MHIWTGNFHHYCSNKVNSEYYLKIDCLNRKDNKFQLNNSKYLDISIFLKITLYWNKLKESIRVSFNESPWNILWILLLLMRYHQNSHVVLAATGMNGLIQWCGGIFHHHIVWSSWTSFLNSNKGLPIIYTMMHVKNNFFDVAQVPLMSIIMVSAK